MSINIENIKKELIGKMVEIVGESTITLFRVTNILEAQVALQDPEIRSGVKDNLLYMIEGGLEPYSVNNKYIKEAVETLSVENKTMVSIYPSTLVLPI